MRHFMNLSSVALIVIMTAPGAQAESARTSPRAEPVQDEQPMPIEEYLSGAFGHSLQPIPDDVDSPSSVIRAIATDMQDDSGEEASLRLAQRPIQDSRMDPPRPRPEEARALDETSVARPHLFVEARMPSDINVGSLLSCELLVRNTGNAAVEGVVLEATLPDNAKLIDTQPAGESLDNGNLRFYLGSMAGGEQRRIAVNLLPDVPGTLSVDARVTFEVSTRDVVIVRQPELSLSVSLPRQMVFGRPSVIRMTVTNIGDGPASDVSVQAVFSAESIETEGNENVVLGSLQPAESRDIDLVWTPRTYEPVPVEFIASGTGASQAVASTVLSITRPNLELSAEGPNDFSLDSVATYSVFASNSGTAEAKEVVVVIHIPESLEIRAIERHADYDAGSRTLLWRIPQLGAGATEVFRMMAEAKSEGQHTIEIGAQCASGIRTDIQYETRSRGRTEWLINDADTDPSESVGEAGTAQSDNLPQTR